MTDTPRSRFWSQPHKHLRKGSFVPVSNEVARLSYRLQLNDDREDVRRLAWTRLKELFDDCRAFEAERAEFLAKENRK